MRVGLQSAIWMRQWSSSAANAIARRRGDRRTRKAAGAVTFLPSSSSGARPASHLLAHGGVVVGFRRHAALAVIAAEIVEDLEAVLDQFREIALDLGGIKAEEIA